MERFYSPKNQYTLAGLFLGASLGFLGALALVSMGLIALSEVHGRIWLPVVIVGILGAGVGFVIRFGLYTGRTLGEQPSLIATAGSVVGGTLFSFLVVDVVPSGVGSWIFFGLCWFCIFAGAMLVVGQYTSQPRCQFCFKIPKVRKKSWKKLFASQLADLESIQELLVARSHSGGDVDLIVETATCACQRLKLLHIECRRGNDKRLSDNRYVLASGEIGLIEELIKP